MNTIQHRVAVGEKLTDIARAYGVRSVDVVAANPWKDAVLAPGVGAVFVELEEGELLAIPGSGVGEVGSTHLALQAGVGATFRDLVRPSGARGVTYRSHFVIPKLRSDDGVVVSCTKDVCTTTCKEDEGTQSSHCDTVCTLSDC